MQKSFVRPIGGTSTINGTLAYGQKVWWLDVASPTWEDMLAIGTASIPTYAETSAVTEPSICSQILHLHPLTLEDILHQDPREKLEVFPRLGYYFIVFRAVDARFLRGGNGVTSTQQTDELRVSNVYITVFREGICSVSALS
jgi:magnesium transporter